LIESIIVLIGNLILPYLVLSILAMLLVELIAGLWHLRARILEQVIGTMVGDPSGKALAADLYQHPLIESLSPGGRKPAYIPRHLFALAFIDEVKKRAQEMKQGAQADNFSQAIQQQPDDKLRRGLQALLQYTPPGFEARTVETWFLEVMDQASGLYRWRTLLILIGVATGLILILNFDAIRISNYIARRGLVEKVLEARIESMTARDSAKPRDSIVPGLAPEELASIQVLAFPIGWQAELRGLNLLEATRSTYFYDWLLMKLIGLATSILAVTIGAPFIFDTLNKFMVVRFTVKPYERFPEEA
jgi:hypothetical protein